MPHRRPAPAPPLPGTGRPPSGLFISRGSALLARPPHGFRPPLRPTDFTPRSLDLLFRAGQLGWRLYLIGNEDAVARGRLSDSHWNTFEVELHSHIHGLGIPLTRSYACLDHPEGKGPHRRDSVFRFPNTGSLYHAAQEDGIELRESWLVSGDTDELAAGWRAGLRVAALEGGHGDRNSAHVESAFTERDLPLALQTILAPFTGPRAG